MREESHGTAPLRLVGSVRFGSGFWFWFWFADSQYRTSPPLESMCGRSLGNLRGVPNLRPRYSSPHPRRSPYVGCATGVWSLSLSPDSELLALLTRARWLFDSPHGTPCFQRGRTLTLEPPSFGHSATLGSKPMRRCPAKPIGNHSMTARIHAV